MSNKNDKTPSMEGVSVYEHTPIKSCLVLDTTVHAVTWEEVVGIIRAWGSERQSKYICLCNVHSIMTARSNNAFANVLENADLVLPDGLPIAWQLRKQGFKAQERIGGPDLMQKCSADLEQTHQSIFFYGSTVNTLKKIRIKLEKQYPLLQIAGTLSPPFRELTPDEENEIAEKINDSGANIVFVALGCPRQEEWMIRQRGKIHAVMIGLGAAFDFYAGTMHRAPLWMQRSGLEWLHRLASEPKRLWRRYLVTNTSFIFALLTRSILK